jgi:hypothetical protein
MHVKNIRNTNICVYKPVCIKNRTSIDTYRHTFDLCDVRVKFIFYYIFQRKKKVKKGKTNMKSEKQLLCFMILTV